MNKREKCEKKVPVNHDFGASNQLLVLKFFFVNSPTLPVTYVGIYEDVSGSQSRSNDGFHILFPNVDSFCFTQFLPENTEIVP